MRRPITYTFLTLPRYSMIAVVNAVEPLRMANLVTGQTMYEWTFASLEGTPTTASNGMQLSPTHALADVPAADLVFVCGGVNIRDALSPALLAELRRLQARGQALGALCTGGYVLAEAGLLDGYRATIHWENLPVLGEQFPRVLISDQLFTIDRDRYTCSGGIAPLDLMLHLVRTELGPRISQQISEQFIVERARDERDRQYVPLRARVGASHESLIRIANLMEQHIEKPLSLDELAERSGLSRRQIERLFKRHLQCVPKKHYLQLRLRRSRELLLQTSMSIEQVAAACGFQSPTHFSRCYRQEFGKQPGAERNMPLAAAPRVPTRAKRLSLRR